MKKINLHQAVCILSRMVLLWSSCVLTGNSLKEFSLARFSTTSFANNSVIDINLVGEGFEGDQITDGGALECHTDDTTCCRGIDNPNGGGRGEWYYPNGTVVPPPSGGTGFYRTRDHMVLRLNSGHGIRTFVTGVYRCVISGAGGVTITRYITLGNGVRCTDLSDVTNGTVTYTPPRSVSAELHAGQRYTGTIATYSCSSGYQLVGGSSLRACGPDGNWNGTAPTCDTSGTCALLSDPENGQVQTPSEIIEGTIATYSCDTGYNLIGSSSRTCGADGMWTSSEPECELVSIQIRLGKINNCIDYSTTDSLQKIEDISSSITESVMRLCSCSFNSSFFSGSRLRCFDESPQIVTFRTQLSETVQASTIELVSYIEQWIGSTEGLVVNGVQLTFQTNDCPLLVGSFDSEECPGPLSPPSDVGGIVGGVIGALLFVTVVVVMVTAVVVFLYIKRRQYDNKTEVELQQTAQTVISSDTDQTYEVVESPAVPVEYEEIDKFQETRGNSEMIEQTHKGGYEYTECPAYAPNEIPAAKIK